MRRPTERRWVPWLNGVRRTTSHSTSTRPRSWWWITGDRAENTSPSPSTRHPWSGWAALSSSAFTSLRISHGLLTRMQCWRRHISVSSSWDSWGSLERAPASSDPSTPALWRVSWPAVSPPFGNSTAGNRRALQRVVRTVRHIVGGELPSLQDIYTRRRVRKARRIIKNSSHPSHSLSSQSNQFVLRPIIYCSNFQGAIFFINRWFFDVHLLSFLVCVVPLYFASWLAGSTVFGGFLQEDCQTESLISLVHCQGCLFEID